MSLTILIIFYIAIGASYVSGIIGELNDKKIPFYVFIGLSDEEVNSPQFNLTHYRIYVAMLITFMILLWPYTMFRIGFDD